jgi:hypothetical protein
LKNNFSFIAPPSTESPPLAHISGGYSNQETKAVEDDNFIFWEVDANNMLYQGNDYRE